MTVEQELWALAAAGDPRAVKRRYSQALKVTRPDEDPVAFQRLHDAYQRAMARCEATGSGDVGPESLDGIEAASAPPLPAQPDVQVLHVAQLPQRPPGLVAIELLERGATLDTREFTHWLRAQAAEWSLDTRDAVSGLVLSALRMEEATLRRDNVTALYHALGWDDVSCRMDPRELEWLAVRANGAWLQLPEQHRALSATVRSQGQAAIAPDRIAAALDVLRQPRSRRDNVRLALFSWREDKLAALLAVLGCHSGAPLPDGIDPGQAAFWSDAAQPFHPISLKLAAVRTLAVGCVLALLTALAARFTGIMDWAFPDVPAAWRMYVAMMCALLAPALLVFASRTYRYLPSWQWAQEHEPTRLPWLRILALPLLIAIVAAVWIAVYYTRSRGVIFWAMYAMWPVTWWILRVARWRFHARRGREPSANGIAGLGFLLAVAFVTPALAAALFYWLLDLVRHGRVLRWRALPDG